MKNSRKQQPPGILFWGRGLCLLEKPVANDVCDRDDGVVVLPGEGLHLGPAGHGAVRQRQFAEYGAWGVARDAHQIDAALRMPAASEHPLLVSHERKEMARSGEVLRPGMRCDGGPDRRDPL